LEDRAESFSEFFEMHERRLRAFALRRTHDPGAADDLVGRAMTIAWQKFDGIPAECAFGWLCGVAVRVAANDDRGRRRRQALVDRLTAEAETRPLGAYLDDEQLLDEQRRAIDDAFASLDPDDREILRLATWDGLDDRELAAAFEVSPPAARKRLSRARRRFRDFYSAAATSVPIEVTRA
jgi:RNA polymerase sigma-70 factor, ECF subfamily